ncbi:MAG: glycosyltransferase family 39 protein [Chloroflexota bacterium]|nr:glycosyltransferase family 39 protein [Chloroflexota bacterium]
MTYGTRSRTRDTTRLATPPGGLAARREAIAAEAVTFPVLVGLVHFVIVQLAASIAYLSGTPREDSAPYRYVPVPMEGLAHVLVEPLRQWDGFWYKLIAEQGYGGPPPNDAFPAFWPLYPWLMAAGSRLTGASVETAGWVISHVAFLVALTLLYRLVALDFDRPTARRTLLALALFPTAFFFSAVYTESLFLMLAVGALLAARQGNWLLAGILGALTALTRFQGMLLLVPFAVLFLQQHRFELRRWFPNALFAALPILGPATFALHLDRAGKRPLDFYDAQQGWDRFSASPLETFRCATVGCDRLIEQNGRLVPYRVQGAEWGWVADFLRNPTWEYLTSEPFRSTVMNSDTLELVCTLLFLGLAAAGLRQLPLYQSAYIWPALVLPLFGPSIVHPLFSLPRFGITLFPLFIMLVLLLKQRRWALPALLISTVLLVILTAQFAQWYWVS